MNKGIVYVLVNEAFDSYVKIGRTINLEQRLKQLDNTSVPLPFRCVFAVEVPDMDIAADEDGLKALENRKPKRRVWTLFDAELKAGDVLTFTRDEDVTVTVIDERKIEFRGDTTSVSGAALTLLHELGYTWKTVNGWGYWLYDGETIGERLNRLLEEREGEE